MITVKKLAGSLIAAFLLIPCATAAEITWNFTGTIKQIFNPGENLPTFLEVNSPYQLTVTFDPDKFPLSASQFCNVDGCSALYQGLTNDAMRISANFPGKDCEPGAGMPGNQACTSDLRPATLDQIWLFNDHRIPSLDPGFFDRMTFAIFPEGNNIGGSRWNFTLGGPIDTFSSIIGGLPTTQDPDFFFQELRVCDAIAAYPPPEGANPPPQPQSGAFSPCAQGRQLVVGDSFAPVPEPATLALLGMGLAGMGFARRRKHAI